MLLFLFRFCVAGAKGFQKMVTKRKGVITSVFFYAGYGFLYIPIFLVVIYSFNEAQSVFWSGFSLKWYRKLFENEILMGAALESLKIALLSSTLAVIFGTLCAYSCERTDKGYRVLAILSTTPLVIPEIVMGLSMLLLFICMQNLIGWPQKGVMTVTIAHSTLGIAYVTTIVRARLARIDRSIEEAALDLGARPLSVFIFITFPMIFPALVSGWLITFVLSLDDVVLASFTSGPGASTLPIVIFSNLRLGYTPQINALAVCIILIASLFIVCADYTMRKRGGVKKNGE
ncbi:ABC transporter permease [Candidatus Hydrogenosomobacter endosymbioticus]|nr:ABC transporter permease subunit [Candidatus Hydrogenosomobacter endosymbioticus]